MWLLSVHPVCNARPSMRQVTQYLNEEMPLLEKRKIYCGIHSLILHEVRMQDLWAHIPVVASGHPHPGAWFALSSDGYAGSRELNCRCGCIVGLRLLGDGDLGGRNRVRAAPSPSSWRHEPRWPEQGSARPSSSSSCHWRKTTASWLAQWQGHRWTSPAPHGRHSSHLGHGRKSNIHCGEPTTPAGGNSAIRTEGDAAEEVLYSRSRTPEVLWVVLAGLSKMWALWVARTLTAPSHKKNRWPTVVQRACFAVRTK
jgi:hypothetical protein